MKSGQRSIAGGWILILLLVAAGCVGEGPGSDFDQDGLTDEVEDPNENFEFDEGETSFLDPDTDADTLCDGQPKRPRTDCNGCEDCNRNGFWEPCLGETDPLNDDTDNDGVRDDQDPTPVGGIDCSGGNSPRRPGDSLPPGEPFPSESAES